MTTMLSCTRAHLESTDDDTFHPNKPERRRNAISMSSSQPTKPLLQVDVNHTAYIQLTTPLRQVDVPDLCLHHNTFEIPSVFIALFLPQKNDDRNNGR